MGKKNAAVKTPVSVTEADPGRGLTEEEVRRGDEAIRRRFVYGG